MNNLHKHVLLNVFKMKTNIARGNKVLSLSMKIVKIENLKNGTYKQKTLYINDALEKRSIFLTHQAN